MLVRWWAFPLLLVASAFLAVIILIAFAAVIVYPTLPSLEVLTDYQPKIPLRCTSGSGGGDGATSAWGSGAGGAGKFSHFIE